jgi:NADH:ubiquinone reductase (H+-translocating)
MMSAPASTHRVVIVGGGAGGLELATKLGEKLGERGRADITLIESARAHFWKPHLHQLAAGSMDVRVYETDYLAQSHWHGFRYRVGRMNGLDRTQRLVHVAPFVDADGDAVTPLQSIGYDTLVIAVGSRTNDFGTPGAREFAIALDDPAEAERFHRRLVNAYIRAQTQAEPLRPEQLHIAIIGAGATGVELAAELHNTTRTLVSYGLDQIDVDRDMRITLIEAVDRILPALPARISNAAARLLATMGIGVRTSARVAEVLPNGVRLASGEIIPAELVVWAAGVKAPDFLGHLDGLETNRINQLVVRPTLQTTRDAPTPPPPPPPPPTPAGVAHGEADKPAPRGRAAPAVALPRLRLARLARRILHGGEPDGYAHRRQHLARGLVRANDVPVAVQDARARTARLLEDRARYRCADDHAADRAAREAALRDPIIRPSSRLP